MEKLIAAVREYRAAEKQYDSWDYDSDRWGINPREQDEIDRLHEAKDQELSRCVKAKNAIVEAALELVGNDD